MRPLQLTLRGITRFDRLELDLADMPPGLIGLVGPNGEGKTTIMEALGPAALWLEFPSRPGPLFDRANARDGLIWLRQEHGGRVFDHRIHVDVGTGRSGAGVSPVLTVDGEVQGSGARQADYAEAIGRFFPDRRVFMASVYASQTGVGSFTTLDVRDRRELFASMLGTAELQALSDRAREACRPLERALGTVEEHLARARAAVSQARALEGQLVEALERVEALAAAEQAALEEADRRQDRHQEALAALGEARRKREAAERLREARVGEAGELTAGIAELEDRIAAGEAMLGRTGEIRERAATHARLTGEREALVARFRAAEEQVRVAEGAVSQARRSRELAERALADAEAQVRQRETDAAHERDLAARAAVFEALAAQVAALQDRISRATGEARALATAAAKLETGSRGELARAEERLAAAKRAAALLGDVPCKGGKITLWNATFDGTRSATAIGVADAGGCRFLTDARRAAGELPALEAAVAAAEARALEVARAMAAHREADAGVQALEAEARALQARQGPTGVVAELAAVRRSLERSAQAPARAVEARVGLDDASRHLATAEGALATARAAVGAVRADGEAVRRDLAGLAGAVEAADELTRTEARLPAQRSELARARARFAVVAQELEVFEVPDVPAPVLEAEAQALQAFQEADVALTLAREAHVAGRELAASLRGRLEALGDPAALIAVLEARRDRAAMRRAAFRLIEEATGRTGIQALEIDAAGPHVSRLTTDLLEASYGPRFGLALRTVQEASGRHVQREVFDLLVTDGARPGGPRPVSDLSGGERVLIDEALKLALAVFNAQRWGVQVASLWRDECDGRLDDENARRYPAMLRRALKIGGWRNVFFVSHRREVWSQADALIRVGGGRAALEL